MRVPRVRLLPLAVALAAPAAPATAEPEVAGRVVALTGSAKALAADDSARPLACHDPIFVGERVVTDTGSRIGVVSAAVYTGLNEDTKVRFAQERGLPHLELQKGHLRVVDTGSGDAARVDTPGLRVRTADRDTEAFAFGEKTGTLSMVCPWEAGVTVERLGQAREHRHVGAHECGVGKPGEALFTTTANHERLPVLARSCGAQATAGPVELRFTPSSVAFESAPEVPVVAAKFEDTRQPCDIGGEACVLSVVPPGTLPGPGGPPLPGTPPGPGGPPLPGTPPVPGGPPTP